MEIIVTKDYRELSRTVCEILEKQVIGKPDSVLGLATGGTPLGTYEEMVKGYEHRGVDYSCVTAFNLDEYVGLGRNHSQSYHSYMNDHLFHFLNIPKERVHIPNGMAEDLEQECATYEDKLNEIGPPDLQILGIGANGHIGFNEPGTSFASTTHVVDLAPTTRKANARFFTSLDKVPEQAITMGIRTIMKSRHIVLLASGSHKLKAVKTLIDSEPNEQFPASILKNHPHVTLVTDKSAKPYE
ncbi:glucosamine-6-phosphate deaminase [Halobacillus alkaliphilus]|uniref:Glucosamine-6-phosphate deaminase n=1 Tax=Halobacillus alkaliphilus TaxID=396056 RepID=A0A1I2RMC5_9BACI|nr:glucosamine-6-phosphate deaminase [Halobacillus alkaliphilus]SFG41243.1 glucosamine-6-phosphate deaminase [Halobacillus alkaliphilus]